MYETDRLSSPRRQSKETRTILKIARKNKLFIDVNNQIIAYLTVTKMFERFV